MTNVYQLLTTATETASGNGDVLTSILSYAPLVLVIIAFYFLLIRPQQKKDKEDKAMREKQAEIEAAQGLASKLRGKEIKIITKAGEGGKLFGAITSKDIAEEIYKNFDIKVDKKKVVADTIKHLGNYDIEVKLYAEISTKMKVIVCEE